MLWHGQFTFQQITCYVRGSDVCPILAPLVVTHILQADNTCAHVHLPCGEISDALFCHDVMQEDARNMFASFMESMVRLVAFACR